MGNDEVDLWATDEVHFQQHGSRCRMWVPPETKDPVLLHHPTRRSVGYFGAVRLRDGKFRFSRETGKFNAVTFLAFLKRLRRTSIPAGRRVVVITDNAKYHHARLHKEWRENHAEDFALEYLPPYSPELNPIERVWNACSPRTNEVLRREMPRVLAGFATFWQFFTRVYTHLHVGQDVWQTDIQGLQQITAGRIRHGDAQATTALFDFHFRRTQGLQLL